MKTIAEVSKQTLQIEKIILSLRPGEFISYQNIQTLSGVKMDNQGKQYLRSALRRLKMEYTCTPGAGVTTASATNSSGIIASRVIKIDNSVKRAEKTTKNIYNKFYAELPSDEQKQVNFLAALFGTIRSYSQSAKKIFSRQTPKIY